MDGRFIWFEVLNHRNDSLLVFYLLASKPSPFWNKKTLKNTEKLGKKTQKHSKTGKTLKNTEKLRPLPGNALWKDYPIHCRSRRSASSDRWQKSRLGGHRSIKTIQKAATSWDYPNKNLVRYRGIANPNKHT